MVKTKKKEVQKLGLRPSQKAKAEKLRQKHEAKVASALSSLQENIVDKTEQDVVIDQASDKSQTIEPVATITVKNADGDPDTEAQILIQNKIDYTPKVSVVMPVYNVEPYLRQCLDSVTSQTLKEIEIICVDDGSTDASLEILKEYAAKDNRITIITQKNLYAGVARNAGLSQAKGEYLSFLDSDDFFELNMLEDMYGKAKRDDVDITVCQANFADSNGKFRSYYNSLQTHLFKNDIFSINEMPNIFDSMTVAIWNKVYKRKFITDFNLKFQNLYCCNDIYFGRLAILFARKMNILSNVYYHYRQDLSTNTTSNRGKFPENALKASIGIKDRLEKDGKLNTYYEQYWDFTSKTLLYEYGKCIPEKKALMQSYIEDLVPQKYIQKYFLDTIEIKMNIAYAFDDKFAPLGLASIASVIANSTKNETINFIVMYDKISELSKYQLDELTKNNNHKITYLHIDSDLFKDFPLSSWVSPSAWFRCILPNLLPDLDRVIYLDSDTIVRHSLKTMYTTDIEDNIVGAIEDVSSSIDASRRLDLTDGYYFNSGVLLIDCKKWRELNIFEKVKAYAVANKDSIVSSDQDTLNKVLDGRKCHLSPLYDYMEVWWRKNQCDYRGDELNDYVKAKDDATIVHFTSTKPTEENCGNSYRNEFLKYFSLIPKYESICSENLVNEIKQNKQIPVVLATDEKYLKYVYVTILSCVLNSKSPLDFYILVPSSFTDRSLGYLDDIEKKYGCKINLIQMEDFFKNCQMQIKHITYPTYFRLVMANVLPSYYDRCVYLDGDVIVCKDLSEYFNQPLDNFYIAGVKAGEYHLGKKYGEKIGIPNLKQYINAGVTLWNLKRIRQNKITPLLVDSISKNYPSQDQDIVNILFFDNINILPLKYNFMTKYEGKWDKYIKENVYTKDEVKEARDNPTIIHYADKIKPWQNIRNEYDKLWWTYAKQTPYFSNFSKMWTYIDKITLIYDYLKACFHLCEYTKKIPVLRKRCELLKTCNSVHDIYSVARLDIKNVGSADNDFKVMPAENIKTSTPTWAVNNQGIGHSIELLSLRSLIKLKIMKDGLLTMQCKAKDKRYNGERLPVWADYKSIKIDGQEILLTPVSTWHDVPFKYEMPVKDGQEITLEVEQQYHQYTEDELKNVILKLYGSDYIKNNIGAIIDELRNKFPIITDEQKKKIEQQKQIQDLISGLTCYRVDVKNYGSETNGIEISAKNVTIQTPKWATDAHGIGKTVQGNFMENIIKFKAINDGVLRFDFKGQDKRFGSERIEVWVDYKSIKIDSKEILPDSISVWHDKSYKYEMPVKDGQEVVLEIKQQYHQYTRDELRNVLLKLNPNNDYVNTKIDAIISGLHSILPINDIKEKENVRDYFDINKEFFVIDSDNLSSIETKLYGYSVQEDGIIENANFTPEKAKKMNGCGCYVFISRDDKKITISQDFNGCYGLFIYRNNDYFALSNSFFALLNYVKDRFTVSFNQDYANYMIAMDLCSQALSDTIINEIKMLQRNAVAKINIPKKLLSIEYVDYRENTVSIDSVEGMAILDKWFNKWTGLFKNLRQLTNNMSVDLSGGFDSRLSFLLMLKSGIDLNNIRVNSVNGKVHTLAEDYEIASEISNYFGFKLNNTTNSTEVWFNYSLKDILNICLYNKITFHKQMYYKCCKYKHKHFSISGHGGEAIRAHWNYPVHTFKEQYYKKIDKYSASTQTELKSSFDSIIDSDLKQIAQKYNIENIDSNDLLMHLYRETRNRNHFGRGNVDDFFANVYNLEPLLDPELLQLKLNTSDCLDANLLIAVFYTRYCHELLNFRFEGNRSIDNATIRQAESISQKYQVKSDKINHCNNCIDICKSEEKITNENIAINSSNLNDFFVHVFEAKDFVKRINKYFHQDVYYKAKEYMDNTKHFPLSEVFPLIGVSCVDKACEIEKNIDYDYATFLIDMSKAPRYVDEDNIENSRKNDEQVTAA